MFRFFYSMQLFVLDSIIDSVGTGCVFFLFSIQDLPGLAGSSTICAYKFLTVDFGIK